MFNQISSGSTHNPVAALVSLGNLVNLVKF